MGSAKALWAAGPRIDAERAGESVSPVVVRRERARRARLLGALLGALALGACGAAESTSGAPPGGNPPPGGGPPPPPPDPIDPPPPPDPLQVGDVFAVLELAAPNANQFVLHGTIPLPRGEYPSGSQIPFAVTDENGENAVSSQVEVVSWYPDAAGDGASVVEVLAQVLTPDGASPGDRIRYGVTVAPHAGPASPGTPGLEDLSLGTWQVPGSVQDLLADANGLRITARDVFGNAYSASLLDDSRAERTRYGFAKSGVRTYNLMLPDEPDGDTLPHLFGAHAYLTTVAGEELVLLDLRIHNGPGNSNAGSNLDDPLGDVYFDALEVRVPNGWTVVQDVSDPFVGAPFVQGGTTVHPLVRPNDDGSLHLLPNQGQFHRRLALAPVGNPFRAEALLAHEGLGFCRGGDSPTSGDPLFSWWNPATARYFPQSHRLPSLDHLGLASLRSDLAEEYEHLADLVESGSAETVGGSQPQGVYPVKSGVLGWAHPYGVSVGGMVGGDEILLFEGLREVCSASNEGYRSLELQHRMQNDRMPTALWHESGRPAKLTDYLVGSGASTAIPFVWFNGVYVTGTNVIYGGIGAYDSQREEAQSQGLVPDYAAALLGYAPIDYQHYIRYTRSPKFLAWVGNDPLAKDDLLHAAEGFHLSYHEYPQPGGSAQSGGLLEDEQEVAADPGRGFTYGRGEGWGLDSVVAAYALSDDAAWRAEIRTWSERVIDVLVLGQSVESGIVQSKFATKQFQGLYRFRQSIEGAIGENAWMGLRQSVWEDLSSANVALIDQVLRNSCYGMISDINWWPGEHAPWSHIPLGPFNGDASTQWGSLAELLPNVPLAGCDTEECELGHAPGYDNYQIGCSLAYAYELTSDPEFLSRALSYTKNPLPGQTLLEKLEQDGIENIGNRAALLALAQDLQGP